MIRILPLLVLAFLFVFLLSGYLAKVSGGSSPNPLRWAQERRGRLNMERQERILALEHELGLHADRTVECSYCVHDERKRIIAEQQRVQQAFNDKWLSNEAFELPYIPPRLRRGTSSGGPKG